MSLIKRALNAMTSKSHDATQPDGEAVYDVAESVYKDLVKELQHNSKPITSEQLERAKKIVDKLDAGDSGF